MDHIKQWSVYSTWCLFLQGAKKKIRAPGEAHHYLQKSLWVFLHSCFVTDTLLWTKKAPQNCHQTKPKRKKKKKAKHSEGKLQTRKHIKIRSALLQLSGNQMQRPAPSSHSWKAKTITQGLFTLPHAPPSFQELGFQLSGDKFPEGQTILTVNRSWLE